MADADRRRRRRDEQWRRDGNHGRLVNIIYGHYKEAVEALPLEHVPVLAPHLLDAGVCFGFADPVTNIIANTLCLVPDTSCVVKKRKKMRKAKVSREEVLSKIATGDGPFPPEARTIADSSLEGLVIFLTTYFRHLPAQDAMSYLCLAQADLLVAVRLIKLDRCLRGKDQFRIFSHATKSALRCAALAAGVPMVDSFLRGMFGLVSRLNLITQTVAAEKPLQDVRYFSELVKNPLEVKESDNPMDMAAVRIPSGIDKMSVGSTDSLRGVLLDRVHDFYLKAVSRLPMKEFQTHHHRGLLKAGYCFGPFSPVSNIIVNTIWYEATFPASEQFEVDMISTMRHMECRSLNGLVAFLRASVPELSEHEAMVYLLKSDLKVGRAIRMVKRDHASGLSDESGYKAALDASSHPKHEEFLEFVTQSLPTVMSSIRSLIHGSHLISPDSVISLSRLLAASAKLLGTPLELSKDAVNMLSNYKKEFLAEQNIIRAKAQAALQKYEEAKGHCYKLDVICAVNKHVGKTTRYIDSKQQYSHVNFWATRETEERSTLFFAQFSNDVGTDNVHSICCSVAGLSTHDVRCCYCECKGIRIVHPVHDCWDGGSDFERISCGEHKITNEDIISRGKLIDNSVRGLFEQHLPGPYLGLQVDPKHKRYCMEGNTYFGRTV